MNNNAYRLENFVHAFSQRVLFRDAVIHGAHFTQQLMKLILLLIFCIRETNCAQFIQPSLPLCVAQMPQVSRQFNHAISEQGGQQHKTVCMGGTDPESNEGVSTEGPLVEYRSVQVHWRHSQTTEHNHVNHCAATNMVSTLAALLMMTHRNTTTTPTAITPK